MLRASSLIALLTSVWLVACGETHVVLLEPLAGQGGAGAPVDVSVAGNGGIGGALTGNSGGEAGAPPTMNFGHLIHRYTFDGEGTLVVDSVGSADGSLMGGAMLDGAGHVTLDGTDDYVNLPKGVISGLTDVTLIAWLAWNGSRACWQRAFDFGSSDAGEGNVGNATSSLFATPLRCPGTGPATAFETKDGIRSSVDSDAPFPVLNNAELAVVVDSKAQELRLYAAGELLGTGKGVSLTQLTVENAWLGRSQWVQDPALRGTYDEFRIYDAVLTDAELAALAAGPDALER